ncbi:MAG: glycosyltransferase family 2 protein [Chloroflexota bacterium]
MGMRKAPVSACLIVKDEAAVLADCLASVGPFVQEIIVVDTGSTDATVSIARAAGARVHSIEWPKSFSLARNVALEAASQPFTLTIDADERLVPDTAAALAAHCRAMPAMAASVVVRNVGIGRSGEQATLTLTRLLPNRPSIRYAGRIHEQPLDAGQPLSRVAAGVELLHLGYAPEMLSAKDKLSRNLSLLELDLQDSPSDPYVLYQIGRTYAAHDRFEPAVQHLLSAVQALPSRETNVLPAYAPSLLVQLGQAATGLRNLSIALGAIAQGIQLYPDFTDLYFAYGTALLELGDEHNLGDIRQAFEHCLALGEPDRTRYETVVGVGSYRALHNLGVFHEVTGATATARDYYRRAAAHGFAPARERLRLLRAT